MPVNYQRLNAKLNALLGKDLDAIMARQVSLPFLGSTYTRTQLDAWLKKRTDLLIDIRDGNYTDVQITKFMDNIYLSLGAADKLIADKILVGLPYRLNASNADNYDKLVSLTLYKFVLEGVVIISSPTVPRKRSGAK